ncbi:hypothetical protein DKG71_21060 [Streptomyces sp. NEAU-S7GS2]|nr:hypothetical protein DKG71_21060 [Streptomyces sp. NEAU-S7GS2]
MRCRWARGFGGLGIGGRVRARWSVGGWAGLGWGPGARGLGGLLGSWAWWVWGCWGLGGGRVGGVGA